MTNIDALNVWYQQSLVGQLTRDIAGNIGFKYEKSWLNDGFAISHQLPLSEKEYIATEGKAHRFFANLLPEANARMHIVRDLKIANSDFELLKAIGGECAGALSILPDDCRPNSVAKYKQLSSEEFKQILQRKGSVTNFVLENVRPRLSLAGAQDKCPIFFDGNDYFVPQDAAPSTHIVKFDVIGYRHILAYEYLLAQLARVIDLPVVDSQLKKLDDEYFLMIKRYDRIVTDKTNIKRLHQEDFCQALGIGYERKYQQEGGPSFHECYALIQRVSTKPVIDSENLLKWQIFNFLAGNSDGHAKNLALIYDENQKVRLAPFYDLVCTRAIERIDTKLAMSIGGEFKPGMITISHWQQLAKDCGINESYLRKTLQNIAENLLDNIVNTIENFEKAHGNYPALQRVQQVVTKQCKRILKPL